MISRRIDYSYLLDDLRDVSNNYYLNKDGKIINKNGEVQEDDNIIIKTKFYILFCMAYKELDEYGEKSSDTVIDKLFVNRALSNYGVFNSFINTCLGEYRIYDEIGTGKVAYFPYQPVADCFFKNDARKDVLWDYLELELSKIINDGYNKVRVK